MTNETNTTNPRQERGKLLSLDKRIKTIAGTTWAVLSHALGFKKSTMRNVCKGINEVSVNMAFAVAKIATGLRFRSTT